MANPKPPQPERKATAAGLPPDSVTNRETKGLGDSVPVATGTFAKLPMRFGRYHVEKLLGRGAMGAVYLARDTQLGRLVAIKIPKLSGSGAAKLLARLKTEAKAAAQIDHPGVCSVHDAGDIDGTSYIAMQYVEGETLKEHLQKQAHTPAEVVNLIVHLAEGLAEAHSKGIYHRDLKPENIKLNRRGIPVIMDFGLAKLAATVSADAGKTQSGTILGSPAYMSPEQAGGKVDEIDHRSDLYSLGVMLFEMLTGQWPFTGAALQVMGQKSVLEPPSPLTVKPELNPQLAAVCHKLIARKREDRYQTAQEVIAAMKALDLGTGTQVSVSSFSAPQSSSAIAVPLPVFEQEDTFSSLIARKRQEASRKVTKEDVAGTIQRIATAITRAWLKARRDVKWTALAAGILFFGLIGLWAGGVFIKVKTKQGTLVIEVNEPGAEVFVDGEKADVVWADGRMKATVQVKTGKRGVEVKKDGFSVAGKKITFKAGDREVFNAKLESVERVSQRRVAPPPAIAPFNATQAKQHQEAWAGHLGIAVETTNSIGMKLVLIPPGEFLMGSSDEQIENAVSTSRQRSEANWAHQHMRNSERPQHKVVLTKPMRMSATEVTIGQFRQFVEATNYVSRADTLGGDAFDTDQGNKGRTWRAPLYRVTEDSPATQLMWSEAVAFCNWLCQHERLSPSYREDARDGWTLLPGATGYRLPSEAEWEFACRAGTTTNYHFGDDPEKLVEYGWHNKNSNNRAQAVGLKPANPFGLHDMHGNVWEWCEDWMDNKAYLQSLTNDPKGPPAGDLHAARGGSWYDSISWCRSAFRRSMPGSAFRGNSLGFRVVRGG